MLGQLVEVTREDEEETPAHEESDDESDEAGHALSARAVDQSPDSFADFQHM